MRDDQIKELGRQAALVARDLLGNYLERNGIDLEPDEIRRDAGYKWARAVNRWVVMKLVVRWRGQRIGTVMIRRSNGRYQLRAVQNPEAW